MATFNKINQNQQSVTIPKKWLLDIIYRFELSKTEYKVLIYLYTVLDSSNYTYIQTEKVARKLGMSYKKFKDGLDGLLSVAIITNGSDEYCDDGYKFNTELI